MKMNEESIALQKKYDGFLNLKRVKIRDLEKFKANVAAMPVELENLNLQIEHDNKENNLKLTKIKRLENEIEKTKINNKLIGFTIDELKDALPIIKNNLKITEKNLKAVEKQLKDIKADAKTKGIKLEV